MKWTLDCAKIREQLRYCWFIVLKVKSAIHNDMINNTNNCGFFPHFSEESFFKGFIQLVNLQLQSGFRYCKNKLLINNKKKK